MQERSVLILVYLLLATQAKAGGKPLCSQAALKGEEQQVQDPSQIQSPLLLKDQSRCQQCQHHSEARVAKFSRFLGGLYELHCESYYLLNKGDWARTAAARSSFHTGQQAGAVAWGRSSEPPDLHHLTTSNLRWALDYTMRGHSHTQFSPPSECLDPKFWT